MASGVMHMASGTVASTGSAPVRGAPDAEAMVELPGGTFQMGSERFYREERSLRTAAVRRLAIDAGPVTNAAFARFVAATGYVTCAERPVSAEQYPDADPSLLVPGSAVFRGARRPVDLRDARSWWEYVPGADWSHPEGPGSGLDGRHDHPVVRVAFEDACAYACWVGKALPTEAEWEYAAWGGREGDMYAWGEEFAPDGRVMANTWAGEFPWQNQCGGGYERTSPVGSFPANGYGLYDMIGNVWEWTCDAYRPDVRQRGCCSPPPSGADLRVVKGGSFLCAPNYCARFRPAARQGETTDTSTSHIGFRCVRRLEQRESGPGALDTVR